MADYRRTLFLSCLTALLLIAFAFSAQPVAADVCVAGQSMLSCGGSPNACSSYVAAGTCGAAGCAWGPSTVNTTVWTETFASGSDWATYSSTGILNVSDSSNCINDANNKCIRAAGSSTPYNLTKQSNINLASCLPGTAKFNIGRVKENGNLESSDCINVSFSANGGTTWSNRTQVFCSDGPSSTFSTTLNNGLLTSTFRVRVQKQGFDGSGEEAYLDNLSVTCATAGPSACSGSPAACSTSASDVICDARGCDATCQVTNPQLANSCGVDIALIIDSSGSISSGELTQMKTAFKGFVDAFLPNTASQIAVVDFDSLAHLKQDYTSNVTAIKNAIDGTSSGGGTNWEDALEEAHAQFDNRASKPDIYIFASDGNPNYYGDGPSGPGSGSDATSLAQAVTGANAIKASGVRILTLGIGDGLDADNLIAVSSPDAYYDSDFSTLAADLAQLADDLCGGSVTVRKYVDGTPAQNWTFSASAVNGASTPGSSLTDVDGFATFNVENISGASATVNLAETLKSGYTFKNATCTVGNQVRGSTVGTGVNGVAVAADEAVFCVFNNHLVTFCGDNVIQHPNDNGTQEVCDLGGQNGVVCTPGYNSTCTYCNSACGNVTLVGPKCGDNLINGNETCDGTNGTSAHYTCSASCQLTYVPYCGDSIVNVANETCDVGAQNGVVCVPGYNSTCGYCNGVCQPVNVTGPSCGDNIVNGNETCEVGDNVTDPAHYVCGAQTCQLTYVPYCGDGQVNQMSEVCDDGNTNNTDACTNSCAAATCGDTIVQSVNGEFCDDGNVANGDGCNALCAVEFCGDYTINNNGTETCDNGAVNGIACVPEYGNTCSYCGSVCNPVNVTGAFCGDDVVNGNETCEVGDVLADPEHYVCNALTCAFDYVPYCGDGSVNQISEVCDDGNTNDSDSCRNSCNVPTCGNGDVEFGEFCDDGNVANGDGCNVICALEYCGDTIVNNNGSETCDDGNLNNSDSCTNSCQFPVCGNGVVELGETCDDSNTNNGDGCNVICALEYCGDGIDNNGDSEFCDDGNTNNSDSCTNACAFPVCGNSVVEFGETCDDGNTNNGDGCNVICAVEFCGDGIDNNGETESCDDGNTNNSDACTNACAFPVCGNSVVEFGETCDDGNAVNGDGCNAICTFEYCGDGVDNNGESEQCDDGNANNDDSCTNACVSAACGDGFVQPNEFCDDGNQINGDGCNAICAAEFCGDYTVNNNGTETCDNGAVNGIACVPEYGNSCSYCGSTCQPANVTGPFCGDDVVNGQEACEVGDAIADPEHYTCNAQTCALDYLPYCGDGIANQQSESCDDGNTNNTDSCTNTCMIATCGDTFVQDGETCDDGNFVNGDGCTATCQNEVCGDYVVNNNGAETCDNGAVNGIACVPEYGNSCSYCGSTCQPANVTGPFCGDDVVNGQEACEVGDAVADPAHYTCNAQTCALDYNPYCGDALVNQISEVCDDGNQNDTDACSNACASATCGDGVVQSVNEEVCDDGNVQNNDGCNAMCQTEFCGDDVVNGNEICEVGDQIADPENYACNAQTCVLDYVPYCGDGNIDDGEVCDGTNGTSEHYTCNQNCQLDYVPYCGDWIVNQQSEQCDGLNSTPANYVCEENCTLTYVPFCGDNIVNNNETCEVGDEVVDPEHYTCNPQTCALDYTPYCGDQIVNQEGEACDGSAPEGYSCSERCTLLQTYSCQDALDDDLLNGYIVDGVAYVQNDANQSFDVSLAVYQMYALTIDDQTLFDSSTTTVDPYSNTTLSVELPLCAYQIDLVCGTEIPETNPQFGERTIAHHFGVDSEFCALPSSQDVDLSIAPWFPQGRNYIFVCDPTFTATSFTWYFGDGQMQIGSANANVYHTYTSAGEYLVSCTATDGNNTGSDTLAVTIEPLENETTEEPPVDPQDPVCYNSVYDADVVCNGGEITQDLQVGCRKVTCVNESSSLTVLACNKPNEAMRTYFEMYKQGSIGSGLSICLGETCISNNGYAMGQLPICTVPSETPEEPVEEEELPQEPPVESGVADLQFAPWFPQGNNVVLVCENTVENAVFDWSFGDGQQQIGVTHDNVWHTYEFDGLYEASCTARNATVTASDTLNVQIGDVV